MNIYAQRLLNVALATREAIDPFSMQYFAHPCGTPSCALGNYAARTDLQQDFIIGRTELGTKSWGGRPNEWWPQHLESGDSDGVDSEVVCKYFGLTYIEVRELFAQHGCGGASNNKEKAASFIEAFVARKWPIDPAVTKLESELVTQAPTRELVHV